jgi:hypothetical protein
MKNKDEFILRDYVTELRDDPVLASRELFGIELAPHERHAIYGMWTHPWNMLVWGRGTGKTFTDGLYAALACVLRPGEKVVLLGPGFRQAQLIFKEVEDLARNSPIFEDTIVGGITKGIKHLTSEWSIGFKNGSSIVAVPLGTDGSKIRGLRAHTLIIDEVAQVPEEIVDKVAIPFMATMKNPMAVYLGIDTEERDNVLILTTSAYFQFNHAYRRYCSFLNEIIQEGSQDYFLSQINYLSVVEGFINKKVIELAKKQSSEADFRMEYLAEWLNDTMGFYPASLVDGCKSLAVYPELKGKKDAEYVLGVDPATEYNACGFVLVKVGDPYTIVQVKAETGIRYPEICSRILEYMSNFNIVRIGLDRGAGIPILDLFAEGRPQIQRDGGMKKVCLLAIDDKTPREGRRMIQTIQMSSPAVNEVNFGMKSSMEGGNIKWPKFAGDSGGDQQLDNESIIAEIQAMEQEYRMVEAVQNKSGWYSFEVPPHRNKDRYSASLFGLHAAKTYVGELVGPKELAGGQWLLRERGGVDARY